jgi:putative hydrolase of the HAD superfamily
MTYRAVVFDLFQTLVFLEGEEWRDQYRRLAEAVGADADAFATAWVADRPRRETGPLADSVRVFCGEFGLSDADADALVELRREATRAMLVPRDGAVETLEALSRRGFRIGLISNCSGDVAEVWQETPFGPYFDATVFSCEVGAAKPDRRLYEAAAEQLAVELSECVFLDDNPEYASAAVEAGMDAVVIDPPDGPDPESAWAGPRISSPRELLVLPGLRASAGA